MLDTIIVGAGLSGLQAALTCHKAGATVLVLEARDRVGGKTWSKSLETGGCVELGAAWINDSNQRRMYAHTQRFGLELVEQNTTGDCIMHNLAGDVSRFPYGQSPKSSPSSTEDLERIRDMIHDLSVEVGTDTSSLGKLDTMNLDQFVVAERACDETRRMVNVWTQVMLGVDSTEISAACFVDYCGRGGGLMQMRSDRKHGGQYLKVRQGTQSVAKGITKLLPSHSVKLGVVVTKLEDFDAFTKVHTSSGEIYTARKVILSIPSPLYKDIQFQPPLQDRGHFASTSTYLGFYTKVILVYKRAWWTDSGLCGLSLSFNSPVVVARDTSSPADGQYSLTCFVNGSVGREWSKLGEAERRSAVIDHVALMYGNPQEAKEPLTVLEKQWMGEQWSQGAVCPITRPGALGTVGFGRLEPHGNIHFVGTEYSDEWKGYMEGAVCSGEVGAAEVLSCLLENPRRPAGTVLARL